MSHIKSLIIYDSYLGVEFCLFRLRSRGSFCSFFFPINDSLFPIDDSLAGSSLDWSSLCLFSRITEVRLTRPEVSSDEFDLQSNTLSSSSFWAWSAETVDATDTNTNSIRLEKYLKNKLKIVVDSRGLVDERSATSSATRAADEDP